MHRRLVLLPLALVALASAACSKKQPEVAPIPQPGPAPSPAPSPTPTPPPPPPTNESAAEVTRAVTAELGNVIHFDYDKADIKPEDQPILDRKAAIMRANPAVRVRISGHADERGSDEYNQVLGQRRANAAKEYLVARGVEASRIDLTSYGEERPVDRAGTEEAFAKNRRDEFEIIAGGNALVRPR
jgi:peptidoglycan-associated lipoprotein